MANAAIVVDNNADNGSVIASSQALTMPSSNLLTPHPSERWRSSSSTAFFVLDKGSAILADTVALFGLTLGPNATIRLRLSSIDATGAAGDILDTGILTNGNVHFDVLYDSFVYQLASPAAYRYVRFDFTDSDAALLPATNFVEAGCILDGLSESFAYNFSHGGSFQHIDRSRISPTSSGMTLTWNDNTFRRIDLTFEWVKALQRYGVIERLDRVKGKTSNVLLMTDTASTNLPRDSIYGLVTDQTPITFGPVFDLFGKQLRIDERI
jgi:hypothetical protein